MIILSVDARLYISNWSAAVRVFGKNMYMQKGHYCFSFHYEAFGHFWNILTLFQEPKSLHMHVQYLRVHTRVVLAPLTR